MGAHTISWKFLVDIIDKMEKFCLKWNEFETNIRNSFRKIREEQNNFDVTLACDDGHQIEAHKVVLFAGSQFFSNILMNTKHPHPFIYLKGVKPTELDYIVDFLYNGETYIAQDELNMFLETAQELEIKGIQSDNYDQGSSNQNMTKVSNVEPDIREVEFKQENIDSFEKLDTFETSEVALVHTEDKNCVPNTNHELNQQIEEMIEKSDGLWQCKLCSKSANKKQYIKKHAETHIGNSQTCHVCNKTLATRNSLQVHIANVHSELSFTCNICEKSGMTKNSYINHKRKPCRFSL